MKTSKFAPPMQWSGARALPALALVVPAGAQDWPARHYRQIIEFRDRLADSAGLKVLAEDLKKLKRLRARDTKNEPLVYTVSLSGPARSLVRAGACLNNGRVLLWRWDELLELWDNSGQPVWSTPLRAITDIIQAGTAPYAILVQDEMIDVRSRTYRRRLIRFDVRNQRLKDLGVFDLRAWHNVTSESQWLVQIGNFVGGLDLGKLLNAQTPQVEFQWRAQVAVNLECLAFYMCPGEHYNWITRDRSQHGQGMIEYWSYNCASNAIEVRAYVYDDPQARCNNWLWLRHYNFVDRQRYNDRFLGYWSAGYYGSRSPEWEALKAMAEQLGSWTPQIMSCDLGRVGLTERGYERPDPDPGANYSTTGPIADDNETRSVDYAVELRYGHAPPIISLIPQDGVGLTLIDRSAGEDGQVLFALKDGGVLIVDCAGRDIRKL